MAKPKRIDVAAITIRLDAKTRYGVELLSRKQRNSVSGIIEWGLQEIVRENFNINDEENGRIYTLDDLYDPDEVSRFLKLLDTAPEFFGETEERLWSVIQKNNNCWIKKKKVKKDDIAYGVDGKYIRDNWELLMKLAKGEKTDETLPVNPKREGYEDEDIETIEKNARFVFD